MDVTLQSPQLCVTISTRGGELQSLLHADGTEYLWQGSQAYWPGKAIHLFPFIGRLTDDRYTLRGQEHSMNIHGFLCRTEMKVLESNPTACLLRLCDTPETRTVYPCPFEFLLGYRLEGCCLAVTFTVNNPGAETLFFGIGGHPGFNVPLEQGLAFEDYSLRFSAPCAPLRVGFTDACYLSGQNEAYPLQNGQNLPLQHSLFNRDALILTQTDTTVTLESDKGKKAVRVHFPDMPYIGFWHSPNTLAPFVCIEPWASLPARQDVIEEFSQKKDLVALPAGESYVNRWSIECLG